MLRRYALHVMLGRIPCTLILRLFLTPHDGLQPPVGREGLGELIVGEGIELLDADKGHIIPLKVPAPLQQVVVNLARAKHGALHRLGRKLVDFLDHGLELPIAKLFQGGNGELVPQKALRRHHHQGLAQGALNLPPEHVIDLRRGGGNAHLNVVLRAQLKEALKACGGVLRACPFVAVGQKHGQAAEALPLVFAGDDELIDHHLGTVGKVTELRFPDHQRIGRGGGVTVLKGQHRFLGEERIVDIKGGPLGQLVQGNEALTGLLIVQRCVTVGEGTNPHVLPR